MKRPARPPVERYRSPHETFAVSPVGRQRSNFSPLAVACTELARLELVESVEVISSRWLAQRCDDVRRRVEYADRWFAKRFHNWPRLARHSSAPCKQKVEDAN